MAFVFTVEDGTGLPGATSYVSVADALDYFAVDPNAADFIALSPEMHQFYLGWATRVLDQKTDWKGTKNSATQGLRWPRTGVFDRDGLAISSTIVPREVKAATCELARWLLTNDPAAGQDIERIKQVVVDVVEIMFQDDDSQSSYPSIINAILTGLGGFRIGNRQFAKIIKA